MIEVTAYQDNAGRLHKDKRSAIDADFTVLVFRAWQSFPTTHQLGEAATIARFLSNDTYKMGRVRLREALEFLDQHLAES